MSELPKPATPGRDAPRKKVPSAWRKLVARRIATKPRPRVSTMGRILYKIALPEGLLMKNPGRSVAVTVDTLAFRVRTIWGESETLTGTEYRLVQMLLLQSVDAAGVTTTEIRDSIWSDCRVQGPALKVHISKLRSKLYSAGLGVTFLKGLNAYRLIGHNSLAATHGLAPRG